MTLHLGLSPCPNDTFIFDALVNGKIDTAGFDFNVHLEDVEILNQWAAEERLDVTKLSLPALFRNSNKYCILNAGAALGKGVGPLLIAKRMISIPDVTHCTIAVPGVNTTAHFLLHYAFPQVKNIVPMKFSQIEVAVLDEKVDLGVIIHENRFTYRQKGLVKICDLGEVWEQRENVPIPLGCIAIKRSLTREKRDQIDTLIRHSLSFAFSHYPKLPEYTKQHAQEMNEAVMRQHIELYVNDYSLDLGEKGKEAIALLNKVYARQQNIPETAEDIFNL
ncbi:MAG: 1,4-dihydroxy-6-naphthoate synthase [Flavisolibacter sp.]|nr:1,4-dihydroxy-6-naphthoate synthase [Flavisolibacter sp.]